MKISVVIPAYNEAARIAAAVRSVLDQPGFHEVIVVDGGSDDATAHHASTAGARVVSAPRGRARQMNAGAAAVTGDALFFLHADVELPPAAALHIRQTLQDDRWIAGVFRTWTYNDPRAEGAWRFGPLIHVADLRSRLTRYPYGDQGLFVRRADFEGLGGFPDVALMEDLAFSHILTAHGRIRVAPARVRVSGRRWQQRPLFTIAVMNTFPMLYRLGVSTETLARVYGVIR